jgi:hypothetical protein
MSSLKAKILKRNWVEAKKVKKRWRKQNLGGRKRDDEERNTVKVVDEVEKITDSVRKEEHLQAVPSTQEQAPSHLRELAREAYSRSSLHSHKSDPLHRTKATVRRASESNRGNGGQRRGQPNMRLRMNFMLEKIKRDLSS